MASSPTFGAIDVRLVTLHENLGLLQWREPEFLVKSVSIPGRKHPSAQTLQVAMADDALHEPFRETPPAIARQDEDVSKIGNRRAIRDYACETNLPITVQQRET
jgi:hypothetical protein